MSVLHLCLVLVPPLTNWHTIIIVVGTHEDNDGIHILPMFTEQLIRLTGDIVPLASTHAIDVGLDTKPVREQAPEFLLRRLIIGVGNRITKISHTLTLPGVLHDGTGLGKA